MAAKFRKYIVRGSAQEFECDECGAPVLSGEFAVMLLSPDGLHEVDPYCSHGCAVTRANRIAADQGSGPAGSRYSAR